MQWLVNLLIRIARRRPYTPIMSADGEQMYMDRLWLFNPYTKDAKGNVAPARWHWLPSIRLHHILVPDQDRDLHDHPWNARTLVLRGWYIEEREDGTYVRRAGDTAAIRYEQFHRITQVSPGGVWTMFITWRYRGTWGFKVGGAKVPYREYLAARAAKAEVSTVPAITDIEGHARSLIKEAEAGGCIVCIDVVSRAPLAMGNVEMVADVRLARGAKS